MKIVALNGSPRKKWNTGQMLESFLDGVRSVESDVKVERTDVYDLNHKGCRSCFGCRLKAREKGQCIVRDGAYEVLRSIRNCDGLVMASPIYYWNVTAELRALLERLYYPGECERAIPVTCIYTMNQPEEVMEQRFRPSLDSIKFFMRTMFHTEPEEVFSFQTLHWEHPERYRFSEELYQERKERHDAQFPVDLQNAFEAGRRFANRATGTARV